MKVIRIKFVDFWGDFNPQDNFIINTLRKKYVCELSDSPDYLFFSTFGCRHLQYSCVKILFIGENITPDFNICDYALAFDYLDFGDRYMRLPLYLVRDNFKSFKVESVFSEEDVLRRKFCSIVVSNAKIASPMRESFFKALSRYKRVDSGGKLWNNVGGPVADKHHFISQYKFNIAFENSRSNGYTTEKIMDAMIANSLPIYWGDPLIGKDFNIRSFVNISDFKDIDDAVERIVELDRNDNLYIEMLRQRRVNDAAMFHWEEHLLLFLQNIVEKPVGQARYLTDYGMQKLRRRDLLYADFVGNKMKVNKILSAIQTLRSRFL